MKRFGAMLIFGALVAVPAHAQLSRTGGPIAIDAAECISSTAERKVVCSGSVDAVQGDTRMRAERLIAYFAKGPAGSAGQPGSFGEVERIEADGNVFYITKGERARGDVGIYDVVSDTIRLTGNVIVVREDDVLRGDELLIEVSAGRSTIRSGTPQAKTGQRVRAVFSPKQDTGTPAPAPTPAVPAPTAPR